MTFRGEITPVPHSSPANVLESTGNFSILNSHQDSSRANRNLTAVMEEDWTGEERPTILADNLDVLNTHELQVDTGRPSMEPPISTELMHVGEDASNFDGQQRWDRSEEEEEARGDERFDLEEALALENQEENPIPGSTEPLTRRPLLRPRPDSLVMRHRLGDPQENVVVMENVTGGTGRNGIPEHDEPDSGDPEADMTDVEPGHRAAPLEDNRRETLPPPPMEELIAAVLSPELPQGAAAGEEDRMPALTPVPPSSSEDEDGEDSDSTDHASFGVPRERGEPPKRYHYADNSLTEEEATELDRRDLVREMLKNMFIILLNFFEELPEVRGQRVWAFRILRTEEEFLDIFDPELIRAVTDYARTRQWGRKMMSAVVRPGVYNPKFVSPEDWGRGFTPTEVGLRFLRNCLQELCMESDPVEIMREIVQDNEVLTTIMFAVATDVKRNFQALGEARNAVIDIDTFLDGMGVEVCPDKFFTTLLDVTILMVKEMKAVQRTEKKFGDQFVRLENHIGEMVRLTGGDITPMLRRTVQAGAIGAMSTLNHLVEDIQKLARKLTRMTLYLANLLNISVVQVTSVRQLLGEIARNNINANGIGYKNIIGIPVRLAENDGVVHWMRTTLKEIDRTMDFRPGIRPAQPVLTTAVRRTVAPVVVSNDIPPALNLRPHQEPAPSPPSSIHSTITRPPSTQPGEENPVPQQTSEQGRPPRPNSRHPSVDTARFFPGPSGEPQLNYDSNAQYQTGRPPTSGSVAFVTGAAAGLTLADARRNAMDFVHQVDGNLTPHTSNTATVPAVPNSSTIPPVSSGVPPAGSRRADPPQSTVPLPGPQLQGAAQHGPPGSGPSGPQGSGSSQGYSAGGRYTHYTRPPPTQGLPNQHGGTEFPQGHWNNGGHHRPGYHRGGGSTASSARSDPGARSAAMNASLIRLLRKVEATLSDDQSNVQDLKQMKEELSEAKKRITNWEENRGPLPPFALDDNGDVREAMDHVRPLLSETMTLIHQIEQRDSDRRDLDRANSRELSKSIGTMELHPLQYKHEFLHFRQSLNQLNSTAPIVDEDPRVITMIMKKLGKEFMNHVGTAPQSVTLIVRKLEDLCLVGLVFNIMSFLQAKLPLPGNDRKIMSNNIPVLCDYLGLIFANNLEGELKTADLNMMEGKALGNRTRQMEDYIKAAGEWELCDDPEAYLAPKRARTANNSTLNNSNLNWTGYDADESVLHIRRDMNKYKHADLSLKRRQSVSIVQKLKFFIIYIENLRKDLLRLCNDEEVRQSIAKGHQGKFSNEQQRNMTVSEVRPDDGGSDCGVDHTEECHYRDGRRDTNQRRRTQTSGAKTIYPQLSCAFGQGCDENHCGGSAFFCKHWKRLTDEQRKHGIKANKMCKICLCKEHSSGIPCPLGPEGKKPRACKNCSGTDHHEMSGFCKGRPQEYQKNVTEEMLQEEEEEFDLGAEMETHVELVVQTSEVFLEDIQKPEEHAFPLSNHANAKLTYKNEDGKIMIKPEILDGIKRLLPVLAEKVDLARTGKTNEETAGITHQVMVVQSEKVTGKEEEYDLKEAVKKIKEKAASEGKDDSFVADMLLNSKYVGAIAHKFKDPRAIGHLEVGPASPSFPLSGPGGQDRLPVTNPPLFRSIYRVARELHRLCPFAHMGIIPVALLIENNELFPGDKTTLPDSRVEWIGEERYLICHAFVDSGCSLAMGARMLFEALESDKIDKFRAKINTAAEPILLDSFQYDVVFRTKDGKKAKTPLVPMNDLPDQNCFSNMSKRAAVEEFKIPKQIEKRIFWNMTRVVPLVLLGLKNPYSQARPVNPLNLGLRPQLFSPGLEILTVNIMHGDHDLYLSGTFGVDPNSYSVEFNHPRFPVQEENLKSGRLADWQKFDESVLLDVADTIRDYEQSYVGVQESALLVGTEDASDYEGEFCSEDLKAKLLQESCHLTQEVEDEGVTVDSSMESVLKVATEEQMLSLAQVRATEELIRVESGASVSNEVDTDVTFQDTLTPSLSVQHTEESSRRRRNTVPNVFAMRTPTLKTTIACITTFWIISLLARTQTILTGQREWCPSHTTMFDPHVRSILVQKLVLTDDPRLIGNLACSNHVAALKSSQRVVNKTKSTEKLAVLDKQNQTYLDSGKYGILTVEEFQDVVDGKIPSQFFCRGFVEKSDSVTTPVRAISDTSRPIWRLGKSLSTSNPAPRGFTSSLYEMTARFLSTPVYGSLDISKAYHSIHLHEDDRFLFLSFWFDDVVRKHCRDPYITFNTVVDFGFGAAHVSLAGGILKFGLPACKLEESKQCLENETYVDNIGVLGETWEELEKIKDDIVQALAGYNLICDKIYIHKERAADPSKVPDSTVMYGVLWDLVEDSVKPRLRLNVHGFKRGSPQGEDLPLTDFDSLVITRRKHVRLLASLYDLTGIFLTPVIAQAKLLLREIVKVTPKDDLDADLATFSPPLDTAVRKFWSGLANLQTDIAYRPRSCIPANHKLKHIYCLHDAGMHMVASVVYLVSTDPEGNLHCAVFSSKSALHSASVPKNEKNSLLQATALCLQVVTAIKTMVNGAKDIVLYCNGDSTIGSHMLSPDYPGDAESKNIADKVLGILTCISRVTPDLTVQFGWAQGKTLTPADICTKPYSGDLVAFINGRTWRTGYDIYKDPSIIGKFPFFVWKLGQGEYRPLPDYLRKVQDPFQAELLLASSTSSPALPSSGPAPGPSADLNSLFYGNSGQNLTAEQLGLLASDEVSQEILAITYVQTSHGRHHSVAQSAAVTTRAGFEYSPPSPKIKNTTRDPPDEKIPPGFNYGTITLHKTDKMTTDELSLNKLPDQTKARAERRKALKNFSHQARPAGTTLAHVVRLSATAYQESTLLPSSAADLPELQLFPTEALYLEALQKYEHLHTCLNVVTAVVNFTLRAQKKFYTILQVTQAVWIKFLRTDQHFFPVKAEGNHHEDLNLKFAKFRVEDEGAVEVLGSVNQPLLSQDSPLMKKILTSCHTEHHEVASFTTHHSGITSIVLATRRFFAATCPNIRKLCATILRECTGCLRGKSRFFRSAVGPRLAGNNPGLEVFETCSFDELGQITVSSFAGSRKMIKVYTVLFACVMTGAVVCIVTDSLTPAGIRRALQHLRVRTGCTVRNLICDAFPSHQKALLDPEGEMKVRILDARSQHQNYAERKIRDFKTIWRKGLGVLKGESKDFGSWTVLDLQYIVDSIAASINLQPVSPDSLLCPANLLQPAVFTDICERHNALVPSSGLGARRNVEQAIADWHSLIVKERNKALVSLEASHRDRMYPIVKGQDSHRAASVNDVVLVEAGPQVKLGRILSLTQNGTTAEVKIGRKTISQAVKNLKVLSFYRSEQPNQHH